MFVCNMKVHEYYQKKDGIYEPKLNVNEAVPTEKIELVKEKGLGRTEAEKEQIKNALENHQGAVKGLRPQDSETEQFVFDFSNVKDVPKGQNVTASDVFFHLLNNGSPKQKQLCESILTKIVKDNPHIKSREETMKSPELRTFLSASSAGDKVTSSEGKANKLAFYYQTDKNGKASVMDNAYATYFKEDLGIPLSRLKLYEPEGKKEYPDKPFNFTVYEYENPKTGSTQYLLLSHTEKADQSSDKYIGKDVTKGKDVTPGKQSNLVVRMIKDSEIKALKKTYTDSKTDEFNKAGFDKALAGKMKIAKYEGHHANVNKLCSNLLYAGKEQTNKILGIEPKGVAGEGRATIGQPKGLGDLNVDIKYGKISDSKE